MANNIVQSQSLECKIIVEEGTEFNQYKLHRRASRSVVKSFKKWKSIISSMLWRIWQIGSNDPRRIIHSLKVGLALAAVSIFYFMRPLFDSIDGNAIWAVMTVVVVLEFSIGATFSRGLNRCFGTLVAGSLGVGVGYLGELAGENGGKFLLGVSVFALGAGSTFCRFIPKIKKRYDYGVVIFIVTFSLITVSSYHVEKLFEIACERLYAIITGCILCFLISILVFPIWAGDDLHALFINNLEALAASIEGCVEEFFRPMELEHGQVSYHNPACNGYKCVLNSKTTEQSWANFAAWEPSHGKFFFAYPWNQYVQLGAKLRYCAYSVEALNGLLISEIQVPDILKEKIKTPCMNICRECSNILREFAKSMRTMTMNTNSGSLIDRLEMALADMQSSQSAHPEIFIDTERWQIVKEKYFKSSVIVQKEEESQSFPTIFPLPEEGGDGISAVSVQKTHRFNESKRSCPAFAFVEALPLAAFSCVVMDIAARLKSVILAMDEVAKKTKFRKTEIKEGSATPIQTSLERSVPDPTATSPILAESALRLAQLPISTPAVQTSLAKIDENEDLCQKNSCS